jgi:hypothetical protein
MAAQNNTTIWKLYNFVGFKRLKQELFENQEFLAGFWIVYSKHPKAGLSGFIEFNFMPVSTIW